MYATTAHWGVFDDPVLLGVDHQVRGDGAVHSHDAPPGYEESVAKQYSADAARTALTQVQCDGLICHDASGRDAFDQVQHCFAEVDAVEAGPYCHWHLRRVGIGSFIRPAGPR